MDTKEIRELLQKVREIGEPLKPDKELQVQSKNGIQDLVTDMDKNTEKKLREVLQTFTSGCTFIGEEGNQVISDSMWIIDPIDGTTNFINAQEGYAICLAYVKDKQPILGIVYDVAEDTMYWAYKGKGAFVNDKKVEQALPKRPLSQCVWEASLNTLLVFPKLIDLFQQTRGHRSRGCCSLSVISTALGKTDFYLTEQAKCWDYAAADVFLKECQGISWCKKDYFSCEPNLYIATHTQEVIETIKEYL